MDSVREEAERQVEKEYCEDCKDELARQFDMTCTETCKAFRARAKAIIEDLTAEAASLTERKEE